MHCPKCGSHDLVRIHSHGFEKIPRVLFGRLYYKCRKCDWRGGKFVAAKNKKKPALLIIVFIILLVVLTLLLIWLFNRLPAPPPTELT